MINLEIHPCLRVLLTLSSGSTKPLTITSKERMMFIKFLIENTFIRVLSTSRNVLPFSQYGMSKNMDSELHLCYYESCCLGFCLYSEISV